MRIFACVASGIAAALLVACGAFAGDTGKGGPATAGDGTSDVDAEPPAATGACIIETDGVAVTLPVATARATFDTWGIAFECVRATEDKHKAAGFSVSLPVAKGPGTYAGTNARYETYDSDPAHGAMAFTDGNQPACQVTLDAFAPREKRGMTARFDCKELVDQNGVAASVRVTGVAILAPRESSDGGAPPDAAPYVSDAGVPGCELQIAGDYEAHALGYGDDGRCTTTGNDGADYAVTGFADGKVNLTINHSWCQECTLGFSGMCTNNVELDQGVGGRYVASFTCQGLAGADGSVVNVRGRIDGIHQPPPHGD